MDVLIFGCGAIGSTFSVFLARGGANVYVFGKRDVLLALKDGVKLSGLFGDLVQKECIFPIDSLKRSFDVICVSTKCKDTENAAREIKKIWRADTLIISLQNGVKNVEVLGEWTDRRACASARIIFGAQLEKPGFVKISVSAGPTLFGGNLAEDKKRLLIEFVETLKRGGMECEVVSDITPYVWDKMLYNCCLNPLSALFEVSYGRLIETEETKNIMEKVIFEIYNLTNTLGIEMPSKTADEYRDKLFLELIPKTYTHISSMLQDIRKRKKTEIDCLNGYICELGERLGIHTPTNCMLKDLLKAKEDLIDEGSSQKWKDYSY